MYVKRKEKLTSYRNKTISYYIYDNINDDKRYIIKNDRRKQMGLFSSSSNNEISRGDRVRVNYAGIEGIVVEVSGNNVMISYINESDNEVVDTYNISDVTKC